MQKRFKLIVLMAALGFMATSHAHMNQPSDEAQTKPNTEQSQGNIAATADSALSSTTYNANHLDNEEEMD